MAKTRNASGLGSDTFVQSTRWGDDARGLDDAVNLARHVSLVIIRLIDDVLNRARPRSHVVRRRKAARSTIYGSSSAGMRPDTGLR